MTGARTPEDQILGSVSAILAAQGLTPEDLLAHAEREATDGSARAGLPHAARANREGGAEPHQEHQAHVEDPPRPPPRGHRRAM